MYSKIVLCLKEEDEILNKQVAMLKERHHAEVERMDADAEAAYMENCEPTVLCISDNEKLLGMAKDRGIDTNDPGKMKEAYTKAMDMLKRLGGL